MYFDSFAIFLEEKEKVIQLCNRYMIYVATLKIKIADRKISQKLKAFTQSFFGIVLLTNTVMKWTTWWAWYFPFLSMLKISYKFKIFLVLIFLTFNPLWIPSYNFYLRCCMFHGNWGLFTREGIDLWILNPARAACVFTSMSCSLCIE